MKKTLLFAFFAAAFGSTSAFALNLNDMYVSASLGEAHGASVAQMSDDSSNKAVSFAVGNRFTPALSAELAWDKVLKHDGIYASTASLTGSYGTDLSSLPVRLSATAGVAATFTEHEAAQHYRLSPVYGVGAEYALSKTWSVRADYRVIDGFASSGNRLDVASVGLKTRF